VCINPQLITCSSRDRRGPSNAAAVLYRGFRTKAMMPSTATQSGVPLAVLASNRTATSQENMHMKTSISIAVAALALAFAGCNAVRQQSSNAVTVAGCVQSAEQGLGAPGGGGGSSADRFMLTNASLGSNSGAASSSTASDSARTDSSASSAPAAQGTMYALDGNASELRQHVNHQVEIIGRLEPGSSSESSSARSDDPTRSSSDSGGQKLHVESVRMISPTCSR